MRSSLSLLLVVCLTLIVGGRPAHADDPAMRTAKRHYERGQKLFTLQKFDEALEQYQQAFDAKPIPDFLFNIGQCQRNLGDYEAAIFSYRRYLKLVPDAANKEQVEQLIAELEDKKTTTESRKFFPKKQRPPEESSSPIYTKWWFWTGVVLVGAAGGVGIYAATSKPEGPPATGLGNVEFGK